MVVILGCSNEWGWWLRVLGCRGWSKAAYLGGKHQGLQQQPWGEGWLAGERERREKGEERGCVCCYICLARMTPKNAWLNFILSKYLFFLIKIKHK